MSPPNMQEGEGKEEPFVPLSLYAKPEVDTANRKLTDLTIQEVLERQKDGLFAVGRYQFIPATLEGALKDSNITPDRQFSPEVQDKIFDTYLFKKRPAIKRYFDGTGTLEEAQIALAKEFASIPLPHDIVVNGKVKKKGQSYYQGDSAGNAAHVSIADVQAALKAKNLSKLRDLVGSGEGSYDDINRGKAGDTAFGSSDYFKALGSSEVESAPSTEDDDFVPLSLYAGAGRTGEQGTLSTKLRNIAELIAAMNPMYQGAQADSTRAAIAEAFKSGTSDLASGEFYEALGRRALDIIPHIIQPASIKDITKGLNVKKEAMLSEARDTHIGELIKSLPSSVADGLLSFVTAPISFLTNINLNDPNLTPLTPDEQVQVGLESAANVLSLGAGLGARKLVQEKLLAKSVAKVETVAAKGPGIKELISIAEKSTEGALKRKIITGLAEGIVGGTTYAAIANIGDAEEFGKQALINTLFAPAGVAFELVAGLGKSTDKIGRTSADKAYELATTRQILASKNDSYMSLLNKLEGLEQSDDIAEAVVRSKIRHGAEDTFIVTDIKDPKRLYKIVEEELRAKNGGKRPTKTQKKLKSPFVIFEKGRGSVVLPKTADEVNSTKWYNATSETGLTAPEEYTKNADAEIFGNAMYLSDDPATNNLVDVDADDVRVYEIDTKLNHILNADGPLEQLAVDRLRQFVESNAIGYKDPAKTLANFDAAVKKSKTLRQLYKNVEDIQGFNEALYQGGYDAITYVGGTKSRQHKGLVILNPKEVPLAHVAEYGPKQMGTLIRSRGFGKYEAVFSKQPLTVAQATTYKQTGFLIGERVSWKGADYTVVGSLPSKAKQNLKINIVDANNKPKSVFVRELRHHAEFQMAKITPKNIEDQVYKDFTEHYSKLAATAEEVAETQDLEFIPTRPFSDVVKGFAETRGFSVDELPYLENMLAQRIKQDVLKQFPEEFDDFTRRLIHESSGIGGIKDTQAFAEALGQHEINAEKLVKAAETNGMFIEDHHDGTFKVRSRLTFEGSESFNNLDEAFDYINNSGQAEGNDLVDGLSKIGSGMEQGVDLDTIVKEGLSAKLSDTFNMVFDWATPTVNVARSLDNQIGTKFAPIVERLIDKRIQFEARVRPYIEELKKISGPTLKMKKAQLVTIGQYMETASPETLKQTGAPGGGAMKPLEIRLAEAFAADRVDMQMVNKFTRLVQLNKKNFNTIDEAIAYVQSKVGLNKIDLDAFTTLYGLRGKAYRGNVTRLVDAIKAGAVDKPEFIVKHKMTPQMVHVANELIRFYDRLANEFGIAKASRLNHYMTHAFNNYGNDPSSLVRALNDFNIPPELKRFYAELFRTGELSTSEYETNPLQATLRYIRAWGSSKYFQPELIRASSELKDQFEIMRAQRGDVAAMLGKVEKRFTGFLDDVRGFPGDARSATNGILNNLFRKVGWNVKVDVRKHIVNTLLLAADGAFQGYRLHAGFRDLWSATKMYQSVFGSNSAFHALEYGALGMDGVTRKQLSKAGTIAELDVVTIANPNEFNETLIGGTTIKLERAIRKVSDAGFRMSGQKDVYSLLSAGIYMDRFKQVGDVLKKVARGELDQKKGMKQLKLQIYEAPTQQEFVRLVSEGEYEKATRYLARQTVTDFMGTFGHGNGAAWNRRNIGRIAGQYGNWWRFHVNFLQKNLTRGSLKDRAAFALRYAAWDAAIGAAGIATGINFVSWQTPSSIAFTGGPATEAYETISNWFGGFGFEQDIAEGTLKRFLPWDSEFGEPRIPPAFMPIKEETGQPVLGVQFVPGSYWLNDIANALYLSGEGATAPQIVARGLGARITPEKFTATYSGSEPSTISQIGHLLGFGGR